jgi:hypothetical protein
MYSIYIHNKQQEQLSSSIKRSNSELQFRDKHRKLNQKLTQNYERRIHSFMRSMIEDPIRYKRYEPPLDIVPRGYDHNKFLGKRAFKFRGFDNEKERIEHSIMLNKSLDLSPMNMKYEFRSRFPQKEIQKNMTYNFSGDIEKLHEPDVYVSVDKPLQHAKSCLNKELSDLIGKADYHKDKLVTYQTRLNPWGMKKTHFKAVSSISLGLSSLGAHIDQFKKQDFDISRKSQADIKAFIRHNSKAQRRRKIAREVLEKCEMINTSILLRDKSCNHRV